MAITGCVILRTPTQGTICPSLINTHSSAWQKKSIKNDNTPLTHDTQWPPMYLSRSWTTRGFRMQLARLVENWGKCSVGSMPAVRAIFTLIVPWSGCKLQCMNSSLSGRNRKYVYASRRMLTTGTHALKEDRTTHTWYYNLWECV